MAPKIFITGATGYIGGDALYALYKAHPEYEYTALVRNPDKGALVAASYPSVRLVYGDLDGSALLEEESSKADIVLHTADASDHMKAAQAIAKGILASHSKPHPGFWLHTSGTGILCWKDAETKTFGEAPSSPAYNDLEGISSLTSLPDSAFHRDVDKVVLSAGTTHPGVVKTAIVCPPTIYGTGRGPENQRSRQVYDLVSMTLERGKAPQLGAGLTEWDNVHVYDLSDLFVLLVEAAVANNSDMDAELWGEKGYFLVENGHHVWGEVSKQIGQAALKAGYISSAEVQPMSAKEAKDAAGLTALSWGLNSKGYAKRARKYLGWKPKGRNLDTEIPDIVESEAKRLGKAVGYAQTAAGTKGS
jgi:nucleoside-diphosphate-sugar epimerase